MSETPSVSHQRRRSDSAGDIARALDWSNRPSDILLHPHSPLALADVLGRPDGTFDLIANQEFDAETPVASDTTIHAITAARPRAKRQRERMNLLSRHSTVELQSRCRSLLVENALVKSADEQGFYLAAGFIVCDQLSMRAPILLYPALLIHKPNQTGHEVRITDVEPDTNTQALKHLKDSLNVALPARIFAEPLTDYFARLAAAITPIDGLELVFDTALGNAAPAFQRHRTPSVSVLPDVPECFDIALAMTLASDVSLDELHTILKLIPDVDGAFAMSANSDTEAHEDVTRLRDYSVKLAARGLDHVAFAELASVPQDIDAWLARIANARTSHTVADLFSEHQFSVRELARLGGIMELIDKAPADIETSAHGDLAYASTDTLLRRARHQAQLIEDEFEALQTYFIMELIPSKAELLQLIDELDHDDSAHVDSARGVVNADYFHARRRYMEFSREKPAHIEDQHRRRLLQLAKVLRFRELFVNNTEYRLALGSEYRGLRTDWDRLARNISYARELSDVLGSESLAATALCDFTRFRSAMVHDLETLRFSNEALREAIALCGRDWQTRPINDFHDHLRDTAQRIREWQLSYGDLSAHGARTPAIVLSQFTGQKRRDAETERRVRAARASIDDSLRSGRSDAAIVAGTLDWLRDASRHASERKLDIGAIVDHLQIA